MTMTWTQIHELRDLYNTPMEVLTPFQVKKLRSSRLQVVEVCDLALSRKDDQVIGAEDMLKVEQERVRELENENAVLKAELKQAKTFFTD